jgi:3-hydroxyisobutyrate dehydrogenase
MALNILRAGLPTVVWNRSPDTANRLGQQGAEVAASAADAVGRAEVVVTMVTDADADADAVESLAVDQGMLAAMAEGAIWAQMSTIGVSGTERVANLVNQRRPDVDLVDAPVAGSRGPAQQGKLVVFASGPEQVRDRVAPVFDAVGQHRSVIPSAVRHASARAGSTGNTRTGYGADEIAAATSAHADSSTARS